MRNYSSLALQVKGLKAAIIGLEVASLGASVTAFFLPGSTLINQ